MKGEAVLLRHLQKEGRLATDIYGHLRTSYGQSSPITRDAAVSDTNSHAENHVEKTKHI